MPTAPLRPCSVCRQIGCTTHVRTPWRSKDKPPPPRIRGRKLQALRAELFRERPFCEKGCGRVATVVDHVVPLAEGGADNHVNRQVLCHQCHKAKTDLEAARGVSRSR